MYSWLWGGDGANSQVARFMNSKHLKNTHFIFSIYIYLINIENKLNNIIVY